MEATQNTLDKYMPPSQQYPSRPLVTGSIGIGLGIVASAIFASSVGLRIPFITRAIAPISRSFSHPIGRTATLIFAIASLAIGLQNVLKEYGIISNGDYSDALNRFAQKCIKKTSDQNTKSAILTLARSKPGCWDGVEHLQTQMLQLIGLAPEVRTCFPLRTESSIEIKRYRNTNCKVYQNKETTVRNNDGTVEKQISVGFWDISGAEIRIEWGEVQDSGQTLILNAANDHLQGGGGVDGHINTKGGPIYVNNQRAVIGFSFDGDATARYPEKYIAGHAVCIDSGPEFKLNGTQGVILVAAPNLNENAQTDPTQQISTSKKKRPTVKQMNELYSCYLNSLTLAGHFFTKNPELEPTLGLVCLGSGAFGWDSKTTREIMKQALHNFYQQNEKSRLKVTVHLYHSDCKTKDSQSKFVNKFTKDWDVEY